MLRRQLLGSLPLLGAGVAGLAHPSAARAQAARGNTLVVVTTPEPTVLTNAINSAPSVAELGTKIYDGLLEYDMQMQPQPSLAESWEVSGDGKSVTFKLRRGVTWHDGKPFTSADVAFSLLEVVKKFHPRGPGNLGPLEAVDTPDEHTAILRLAHPYPPMMKGLSSLESPIVAKHLYEGTDIRNNPANNRPIGTGPFKFTEWNRGASIVLEKNPNYWRPGRPYLDRLIFRFINDPATRAAALESGEVDVAFFGTITPAEMRRLAGLPNIEIAQGGYEALAPVMLLELNTKKKPLDDRRVRQALAYAIDRKFIAENVWYGFGKPAVGPISSVYSGSGLYTDQVLRFDVPDRVARANALLDEAGYKRGAGGIRFELTQDVGPYGDDYRRMGEYMRQAYNRIGVRLNLRTVDQATYVRRVYTDYDFDMTSGWYVGMGDPTLGVQRQFVTSNIRQGIPFNNVAQYSDPENDRLWAQAAVETDAAKRAELFHAIQRKLVEDSPIIWIMEMELVALQNKRVKNLITSGLGVRGGLYETRIEG
ncbi:peptide/nickel transport system substrate-binding protein [Roseomonas rosea]|uniref:Peptide/nickel transport system substrate-binding protein n=1 Tax=Muricoccus roseus TaxID=198092 RepID=A0A1M6LUR4_9PROT|nr:ABC transporter substrate-binding protein [Roseomonas rosea]SHJ74921.1 peptide/nickel transport system substrate-binding protein [Roseomonas rosea]